MVTTMVTRLSSYVAASELIRLMVSCGLARLHGSLGNGPSQLGCSTIAEQCQTHIPCLLPVRGYDYFHSTAESG